MTFPALLYSRDERLPRDQLPRLCDTITSSSVTWKRTIFAPRTRRPDELCIRSTRSQYHEDVLHCPPCSPY
ncbi:hypothetical protein PUNSTDRAFT_51672 [Punctularia strigosozonata HHB-11173 SS5]|uniref:uncharacterized protein n=1 Tax=Punctularia strigosozonata (strain HHB-11173) TaxID=741275 RepID=UPI0004418570|nr:uncharacterized protein PUNSTDRAFT_51672 [Punctularia strigosozonata HHB-11173 SS5]EIN09396.1 hypothetical protein PUNSTDRAFT_51672 [Punctularia strigosozonata HHB-11173 SS5]